MGCGVDGICDSLWGGESIASDDCHYLLVMEWNGNLVLYSDGSGRRPNLVSEWTFEWQSNSSMFNYSGESEPEFTIDANSGDLVIFEYFFKDKSGLNPMQIWSTPTIADAANGGNFQFTLSDDGCFSVSNSEDSDWRMCPDDEIVDAPSSTMATTDGTDVVESDAVNADDGGSGKATVSTWYIIGGIVFVVLCGCGYYGYKRWNASKAVIHSHSNHLAEQQRRRAHDIQMANSSTNRSGVTDPERGSNEEDSIPHDDGELRLQLEKWCNETD